MWSYSSPCPWEESNLFKCVWASSKTALHTSRCCCQDLRGSLTIIDRKEIKNWVLGIETRTENSSRESWKTKDETELCAERMITARRWWDYQVDITGLRLESCHVGRAASSTRSQELGKRICLRACVCVCVWDFHVVVAWLLRKILCLISLDQ